MKTNYFCGKCDLEFPFNYSIQEGPPKVANCCSCGDPCSRVFKTANIDIPLHMTSEEGDDFTTTKSAMAKSRPSGKDKIFY